jgi:hypothetical protein
MPRRHRIRALVALGSAVAAATTLVGIGAAARPVIHEHENFSDTFADSICGISGTSVVRGVDNFTLYPDNRFKDEFELHQTFTATASGKSLVFHVAQNQTGNDEPIDNGDGTITFVTTFKGLPEKVKLPNGRVLTRDAGNVTITTVLDAQTFELVSNGVSGEKGPHPDRQRLRNAATSSTRAD